jgi:hypothetical protein
MKHFLLEFAETPDQLSLDSSLVEYCHNQNLNVVKNSGTPAVVFDQAATETFTKANGEGYDSDKDYARNLALLMATTTQTRMHQEGSDSDDRSLKDVLYLTDTTTQTAAATEVTDSGKQYLELSYLTATQTITEARESYDSDR